MRLPATLLLIVFLSAANAQRFSYPSIKKTGASVQDFVPKGWTIHDSAYGDLNKDYLTDYVIVLQRNDSVLMVNDADQKVLTQPRVLVILFKKDTSDVLILVEQSNSFILPDNDPGIDDPYVGLAIQKGTLTISFNFSPISGGWTVTNVAYTFRYQQKQFTLIGADYSTFNKSSHDAEDYSYNFLTKKRSLAKEDGESEKQKTSWKTINVSELKTLKTLKKPLKWEVEENIYL